MIAAFLTLLYVYMCTLVPSHSYTKVYKESEKPVLIGLPDSYRYGDEYSNIIRISSRIHIKWVRFNLPGIMPGCVNDYVALLSCEEHPRVQEIMKYCGEGIPPDFYSDKSCVEIKLVTQPWNTTELMGTMKFLLQYQSWNTQEAVYRVRPPPNCFNMRRRKSATTRSIYSPNWPLSYSSHLDNGSFCNASIDIPEQWNMIVLFMDVDLNRRNPDAKCGSNGENDVLTLSTFIGGRPYKHHHFCGTGGTFQWMMNHNGVDRVDFTFTSASTPVAHDHKGFALGISMFNGSLEDVESSGMLGTEGEESQSAAMSVVIIMGVIILLCCAGCFLGITRDYCKRTGKSGEDVDEDMVSMVEEDRERFKSRTSMHSITSHNIMYTSSV